MRELADDVWMLSGFPPNGINVYLLGEVVVDAGTRFAKRRILRQVRGRQVNGHALTHAHADHQGASKAICSPLRVPLWCGAGDVHAMETPGGIREAQPSHPLNTLIDRRLDRAAAQGRSRPARGRRGRRLHRARYTRPFRGARFFLARVGPHVDLRRRPERHEPADQRDGAARAAGGVHPGPSNQPRVDPPPRRPRACARVLRPRATDTQSLAADLVRGDHPLTASTVRVRVPSPDGLPRTPSPRRRLDRADRRHHASALPHDSDRASTADLL
jgi:hypothetical protein